MHINAICQWANKPGFLDWFDRQLPLSYVPTSGLHRASVINTPSWVFLWLNQLTSCWLPAHMTEAALLNVPNAIGPNRLNSDYVVILEALWCFHAQINLKALWCLQNGSVWITQKIAGFGVLFCLISCKIYFTLFFGAKQINKLSILWVLIDITMHIIYYQIYSLLRTWAKWKKPLA